MKYGTINSEQGLSCANCNSTIARDGILRQQRKETAEFSAVKR